MATARRKRNASGMNPVLAGLLVLVALFGALLTLELTGKADLGLRRLWGGGREVQAANAIPIALSYVALEPGQELTRDVLWNPQQNTFNHTFVDKQKAADRGYLRVEEVLGRVLARPKPATQVFRETDFLPPGTPPGITGLVPEGMSALSIPTERVPGLALLGFADHFDLRVSIDSEDGAKRVAKEILEDRSYTSEEDRLRLASIVRGPQPRLLAQAGVVLRPSKGGNPREEKIFVAVHPDDLNGLIVALDGKGDIHCSPRGRTEPGSPRVEVEEIDPMEDFSWVLEISREVQVIRGDELRWESVPTPRGPRADLIRLGSEEEPQ